MLLKARVWRGLRVAYVVCAEAGCKRWRWMWSSAAACRTCKATVLCPEGHGGSHNQANPRRDYKRSSRCPWPSCCSGQINTQKGGGHGREWWWWWWWWWWWSAPTADGGCEWCGCEMQRGGRVEGSFVFSRQRSAPTAVGECAGVECSTCSCDGGMQEGWDGGGGGGGGGGGVGG